MKNRGSTTTETILTMVLLILFSFATLSLVISSSGAYKSSEETIKSESQLRVAQSYLYTKFRQNMEIDKINIEELPGVEGMGIIITDTVYGEDIKTIIFVNDGYLREGVFFEGVEFNPSSSFPIAQLKELKLESIDNKGLEFETVGIEGKSLMGFVAFIND